MSINRNNNTEATMTKIKLTTTERKTLAILGKRLPICDLGKNKFRSTAWALCRSQPNLISFDKEAGRWVISAEGRKYMSRAGKGSRWVKWAAEAGRGQEMIDTLNTEGTDGGHRILREMEEARREREALTTIDRLVIVTRREAS